MSFTSLNFLPFIACLLIAYWVIAPRKATIQNILLLLASLLFVGINDAKAAVLIFVSGIVNFALVQRMYNMPEGNPKKYFFYAGCLLNIAVLAYFKYLHDVISVLNSFFHVDQFSAEKLLLPLGISFFSFQLIGYWIDAYNEETDPEKNLLHFFLYLFYFPKLISGPIERIQNFTPQLAAQRSWNIPLITDGMRQFLWGFFKKMVVSAHCLLFYKSLYANPDTISGINMLLAAIIYMVYIYSDFSGYSDMACGLSKGFGIRITNNFAFPFFATSISEFWKRWHISLTTWIMTYVYTPVAFMLRKHGKVGTFIGIAAAFLTVGLWHGIQSGYLMYGIIQALFFLPLVIKGRSIHSGTESEKPDFKSLLKMVGLFLLVCIAALFFRSVPANVTAKEITFILSRCAKSPDLSGFMGITNGIYALLIALCFAIEWMNRKQEHGLSIQRLSTARRWFFYFTILLAIFFFSEFGGNGFIYAQF
jgi:alginate O-acetyltransferase complex protein AlgI